MSERYATIILDDEGQEVVSNIAQYEGKPPEPHSDNASIVKVGDGVKIGMVKGGPIEAADGYGFLTVPALLGARTRRPRLKSPQRPRLCPSRQQS